MNINKFKEEIEHSKQINLYKIKLINESITKSTVDRDIFILQRLEGRVDAFNYVLHILKEIKDE